MTMTPEERAVIEAAVIWAATPADRGMTDAERMVEEELLEAVEALHKASGGKWEKDDG